MALGYCLRGSINLQPGRTAGGSFHPGVSTGLGDLRIEDVRAAIRRVAGD